MKKYTLLAVGLLLAIGHTLNAQYNNISYDSLIHSPNPGVYYLNCLRQAELDYAQDTMESGKLNQVRRNLQFWMDRIPGGDGDKSDPFYKYAYALKNHKRGSCSPKPGDFNGNWENTGPKPPRQANGIVMAVHVDPANSNFILAGVEDAGLWKTTDGGVHWNCISDSWGIAGAGVTTIAHNPLPVGNGGNYGEMYVGTQVTGGDSRNYMTWGYGQGIWRSTNYGTTWTKETLGPPGFAYVGTSSIEYCPFPISILSTQQPMLLAISGNKLLQKRGTGGTWTEIFLPTGGVPFTLRDIEFTHDVFGKVYVSTQHHWINPLPGFIAPKLFELTYDAGGNITNIVQVIDGTNFGNGFVFNSGAAINNFYNCKTISFELSYAGSNKLYVNMFAFDTSCVPINVFPKPNEGCYSLYSYNIGTGIWTLEYAMDNPGNFEVNSFGDIKVVPNNPNIIYMGGGVPYRLVKNGGVWSRTALSLYNDFECHADVRSIQVYQAVNTPGNPGSQDIVYFGTDGGLTRYVGNTFNSLTSSTTNAYGIGFNTSEAYDIDVSPARKKRMVAAMHNGFYYTTDNTNWQTVQLGDGFNAIYDKRFDHNVQRSLYHYGGWNSYRHFNGNSLTGGGYAFQAPHLNGAGQIDTARPFQFPHDYNHDSSLLYMGNRNMLRSQPYGYGNWQKETNTGALDGWYTTIKDMCRSIAVAPSFKQRKYYGMRLPVTNSAPWSALPNVVFMKRNNLNGWEDETPTYIANGWYNFTDIVVDNQNENRVFLSLGMVNWGPIKDTDRVYAGVYDPVSQDIVWEDMSNGLSELPVTCLVYQNGSDDIIYAGTDAGVYRWDKPQQCWVKFNTMADGSDMPQMLINDLEIDYCNGKLVVASYGRGIWETDLYQPSTTPGIADVISVNTTWGSLTTTSARYPEGGVLIKSGATLTIQGTPNMATNSSTTSIYMPKYAQIIVEKGAKLVVNGAKISNDCPKNWHGIFAYGNGNQPQIISAGLDPHHGIVEMNFAIIENAEDALNNYGGSNNPNTGGILLINDSKFINNIRSVAMMKYHNISGSALLPDLSKFQRNTFEVNDNIKFPFLRHVTMWGVRGPSFESNVFNNLQNTSLHHREAIYTLDASYKMLSNTFNGFYKGIESSQFAWTGGYLYPIEIGDNHFNANEISIHLKNLNFPRITGNILNIGMKQTPIAPGQTNYFSLGSKLESVSKFYYYGNAHTMNYQPVGGLYQYTAGTEVYNTGDNEENIISNQYQGLTIGNDASLQCANVSGTAGLNYKCNTNTTNQKFDFIIQGVNARVRKIQFGGINGLNQMTPTGNVLSQNAGVASWSHVAGGGSNAPVYYYYYQPNTNEHLNINSQNVTPIPFTVLPFCKQLYPFPLTFGDVLENGNYSQISPSQLDTMKNYYEGINTSFNQLNTLYIQLLDNGNTDSLVEEIHNYTVAEQLEVRSQFLAMSPYVTTEALRELADQGTVSNPILFEIILANPDGSNSEEFLNYLAFEKPNPLPSYMIDLIKISWEGMSPRREMFNSISALSSSKAAMANHIQNVYISSNTLSNEDSLRIWLGKDITLRNSYTLIDYLLHKRNFSEAITRLAALPQQYPFTQSDSIEYTAYTTLFNFKKDLIDDTLEINQLDSVRLQALIQLADAPDYSMARTMAQSALCFFYNICYPEPDRELPQVASRPIGKLQSSLENNLITAYPNPSHDFIAFKYNLPVGTEAVKLDIVDAVGQSIYSNSLKGNVGQHIWDVRAMKDGIYIYNVTTKSGEKYSGKVTVRK